MITVEIVNALLASGRNFTIAADGTISVEGHQTVAKATRAEQNRRAYLARKPDAKPKPIDTVLAMRESQQKSAEVSAIQQDSAEFSAENAENNAVTPSPSPPSPTPPSPTPPPTHANAHAPVREGQQTADLVLSASDVVKRSRRKTAKPMVEDEDAWLEALSTNPVYRNIDVRIEHGKMLVWCDTNRQQPTRKRFVAWINRAAERSMTPLHHNGHQNAAPSHRRSDAANSPGRYD